MDRRIAALARRQYGGISVEQLRKLGLGGHGIYERVRTHRLLRLYRGVFAVGHERLRREGQWLAAVLACGPGAVLSHRSAAAMWEIRPSASTFIDVTVPSRAGRIRRTGLRVHRSGRLPVDEVTVRDGIPTTKVARTLLDLADVLPRQALKRAIDESEFQRLFDLTALIAVVENNPGRRGKRVLDQAKDPPHLTRSDLEDRFLSLVARHNLPQPLTNQRVLGYEVDVLFPEAKLVVELDGYAARGTRAAFQSDRQRDRRLTRAGFRPIRVTALDVRDDRALANELADLLRSSAGR